MPLVTSVSLLIGGCATTQKSSAPKFGAEVFGNDRQLCLARGPSPSTYGVAQTPSALPGIAIGIAIDNQINSGIKKNTALFTDRVKALQPATNLYDAYFDSVISKLRDKGYTVQQVIDPGDSSTYVKTGTQECRANWIIFVQFAYIHYFATTFLSSYKPKTAVSLIPYNKSDEVFYRSIFINAELTDSDSTYETAQGILDDLPRSFTTLEKTVPLAANMTVIEILGMDVR